MRSWAYVVVCHSALAHTECLMSALASSSDCLHRRAVVQVIGVIA